MATPPSAVAAPPVRLRLVFDSGRLLRRGQRDEGLRRCWLLVRPELATIADLASHVADRFRLGRSCPRGVVLSMDGLTLPPFESTCIFRDNDTVRVKQKTCKNMIKQDDVLCVQDPTIIEKLPLPMDDKILAIEYKKDEIKHQEEEQGGHQHQEMATIRHNMESNDTSSKRKCRDGDTGIPENSRKKMLNVTNPEKDVGVSKDDNVQHYKNQNGSENLTPSSLDIITKKTTLQAENTGVSEGKQKTDRNHQTELSCETKVSDGNVQGDTKKFESRSARRKKLKRQLRQKAKAELEKSVQEESQTAADCPSPSNQDGFSCAPGNQNESHVLSSGHKTDEESDSPEDIVPILVRPGHIRFGRAGGEQEKSLASETQGTFQWNGTMSKKKGQKWGMNNSKNKNTDINYHARITGSSTEVSHHLVDSKITENGSCGVSDQKVGHDSIDNSASVKTIGNEGKSSGWPLNFESLFPLTRLPKEGDLIAYRLVELSSSWCPELSSYRVGKVLIYDPISLRIILLPVLEYPITGDERKIEEESDMLVDMSPYKEDGSLEIEYSSLLDVRLLKGNEAAPAVVSIPFAETGKKDISLAGTPNTLYRSNSNIDSQKSILVQKNRTSQVTPEKTQKTVWEETGDVPNDKSDIQENGWGNWTPNASTSAWSLRALRSSAIGPTVAILRGKNNQRGKPYNRKYGK